MKREKIKEFFKKVKAFSLFDYLLKRKTDGLNEKIDLNIELIELYTFEIDDWTKAIEANHGTIKFLKEENSELVKKIKNIEKI